MTDRPVSRDEAISLGRIGPATSAYGAHLRRKGILRPLPEPVSLLDTTPRDEASAVLAEVARDVLTRIRL
ncbi:hypothetical protein OKC48_21885 [Methylorubrum extorquens]|uniref:hypothetical protein n=1 Tax=Methylorubrum extorquens TaxID=408 RepID=UPI002236FEA5|nr:hypothetical protein [Methylorubrum extorquens]UYW25894.1 hypothetical protein OKC48_21885 [Methylorubrum extorquens]